MTMNWQCLWRGGLMALLAGWLLGCVPTSENPIAPPGARPDRDIVGTWRGTLEDGAPIYLHLLRRADTMLGALLVTKDEAPESRDEWAAFRIITAEVASHRYMSALWDYNDGEAVSGIEKGYHLLRYTLEPDGSLALFQVNEEKLIEAVRAGRVAGTIEESQWTAEVRLTATTEALVAFLAQSDPLSLFDRPFTRLTLVD